MGCWLAFGTRVLLCGSAAALLCAQTHGTAADLERVREVNLEYARNMPNYVADETAKRYDSRRGSQEWKYVDTVETEITFRGPSAVRRNVRIDGRPWNGDWPALPGARWYGGFGTELLPLFGPRCPTTVEFEGTSEMRGNERIAFRFHSPADGCFVPFTDRNQRFNPARAGRVLVDAATGHAIQLEEDATGFPGDWELRDRKEQVTWDSVRIGDATHLLPVAAEFVFLYSSGARQRITVAYSNHRRFEASSTVEYH
jgi:hypothetical protein